MECRPFLILDPHQLACLYKKVFVKSGLLSEIIKHSTILLAFIGPDDCVGGGKFINSQNFDKAERPFPIYRITNMDP